MALVKTVEMRVLANAGDAQAKLDELAAKGDEIDAKSIRMRFKVDTAEGKAQLDAIKARADELGFKDVSVKVRVNGAGRAIADLMAVRHEEEKVRDGGIRARIGGALSNLPGMLGGLYSSGISAAGNLPFVGGLAGAGGGAGLAAVAAGLAAIAAEATAVVSGFTAAGAGAGAFALLAMPAVKQVESAYQGLNKAQQNYQKALALEKLDPTKGHAAGVKSALDQLNLAGMAIGKLPGDEQKAVDGLYQLRTEFGKMSASFAPQAFKVFADGLQVIQNLLPSVKPFADTFATSIDGLLKKVGKFTAPSGGADKPLRDKLSLDGVKPPPTGWQTFLDKLHTLEGPAINSIGTGIGKVAVAIGNLLTTMSSKDVAHGINILFDTAAVAINVFAAGIRLAMQAWDTFTANVHGMSHAFDEIRHGAAGIAHDLAHNFDTARHAVATAAHDIAHAFDNVKQQIAARFDGIKHAILAKFDGAAAWLKSTAHDIANAFDHVRHDIAAWFDGIKHAILAKFDGAGAWLLSIGKSVVQGLINGLNAAIPGLSGVIGTITGMIKSIGHAVGVRSPSTLTRYYGEMIVQGLALGMESGLGQVERAAGRMAAAAGASPAMGARGYGRGYGGDINVHFSGVVGDPQAAARQVVQVLRAYKRTGGGQALGIA